MTSNDIKFALIGGDGRQSVLARYLCERGFETAIWGASAEDVGGAVKCNDFESAIRGSRVVVLPINAFAEGKYVISPDARKSVLTLSHLLFTMEKDAVLLCGNPDRVVENSAKEHGIKLLNYLDCERLQIKNAIPTAEGALEIAMRELPITVFGCTALVCGYGRIGKVLSSMLKSLGADVYVAARNESDLAYIEAMGYQPVCYGESFLAVSSICDVVFNTVPAEVVDEKTIEDMTKCRLIIDLASKNGGVNFAAAKKKNIKCIHALALPGKVAPITAGEMLGDSILSILSKNGVVQTQ